MFKPLVYSYIALKNWDFMKSRGQSRGSPGSIFLTPKKPGVDFGAGVGDISNPILGKQIFCSSGQYPVFQIESGSSRLYSRFF